MNAPTRASNAITVGALATLQHWSSMAQGAFSENTLRAWRADWDIFVESCRVYRLESLPAAPKTVRAFVFECLGKGKRPATVRRYVSTIGRAHRASGVEDPAASEDVRLALKEMGRNVPARQKQARGLTWAEIEVIEPRNLRLVLSWLKESGSKAGPMFVRVHGATGVGGALTAQNVMTILRKVGQWIGLDKEEWEKVSGHSARAGAAQDLFALNIDVASVMQAGRWKDTRMPIRYGEKVLASRGGMARAAKQQGRA
jgi:hypothetical protein